MDETLSRLETMKEEGPEHAFYNLNINEKYHSTRVAELIKEYYKKKDKNGSDIGHYLMYLAGRYHDIGKSVIDPKYRDMSKELDEKGKMIMMKHPEFGAAIINNERFLKYYGIAFDSFKKIVIGTILWHHKNFDGTGYPEGKPDQEIFQYAMDLNICDDFDAATDPGRIYNGKVLTLNECREDMFRKAGKEYDPDKLKFFFEEVIAGGLLKELYPF